MVDICLNVYSCGIRDYCGCRKVDRNSIRLKVSERTPRRDGRITHKSQAAAAAAAAAATVPADSLTPRTHHEDCYQTHA